MRKVILFCIGILLSTLFPQHSMAQDQSYFFFINPVDSAYYPYTFERLQSTAPEGYLCGYVVKDSMNDNLYSIFLYKKQHTFRLILNTGDSLEERKISKKLACRLEKSVIDCFANVRKMKDVDAAIVCDDVDYNKMFVMLPSQIDEYWSQESILIPNELWRDEYFKFSIATLR